MKARMYLLLSLMALTILAAKAEESFRCRTTPAYTQGDTNISEQIEADLLTGVWIQDATMAGAGDRVHTMLQFAAGGEVDFMRLRSEGGYATDYLRWWVEDQNNGPMLLLEDRNGRRNAFRVEQTCLGIQLTNLENGERLALTHNSSVKKAELERLQRSLIGDWSNTMYPFDLARTTNRSGKPIADAFLKYEFQSNGAYVKIVGGEKVVIRETGSWEVSKDGRFLLMHSTELHDGLQSVTTRIARIKYLQFDELVLEHALRVNDEKFCTRQKDFFFNKS